MFIELQWERDLSATQRLVEKFLSRNPPPTDPYCGLGEAQWRVLPERERARWRIEEERKRLRVAEQWASAKSQEEQQEHLAALIDHVSYRPLGLSSEVPLCVVNFPLFAVSLPGLQHPQCAA